MAKTYKRTQYTVSAIPFEMEEASFFTVKVFQPYNNDLWVTMVNNSPRFITRQGKVTPPYVNKSGAPALAYFNEYCLMKAGKALELAESHAAGMTVNGFTVQDVLKVDSMTVAEFEEYKSNNVMPYLQERRALAKSREVSFEEIDEWWYQNKQGQQR